MDQARALSPAAGLVSLLLRTRPAKIRILYPRLRLWCALKDLIRRSILLVVDCSARETDAESERSERMLLALSVTRREENVSTNVLSAVTLSRPNTTGLGMRSLSICHWNSGYAHHVAIQKSTHRVARPSVRTATWTHQMKHT